VGGVAIFRNHVNVQVPLVELLLVEDVYYHKPVPTSAMSFPLPENKAARD
jgi:hypothetical protein